MLLDDETAVHECLAELPSTEVVENLIKAIKNVYPSLEIVVHPEDLEIQEECWCIKPTSLDRLARQYESFLAETLGRLRKELEQIPAKIEELRGKLRSLPEANTAVLRQARTARKELVDKKAKVRDWEHGSIKKTSGHQRAEYDVQIAVQDRIIQGEEWKQEARKPHNRGIEDAQKRQKQIEQEILALEKKDELVQHFSHACQNLSLAIPKKEVTPLPRLQEKTTATATALVPAKRPTFELPPWLTIKNVGYAFTAVAMVLGGTVAVKKYQQHQEQKLHWKMARVGEYFPSETVATLDEEIVNVCSTLGAQIKDGNRNHNLRLSEEQIATLVQLRHPLKACMVEPRLTYIDNKLHEQVQKEWREFFAQHHAHITLLYSQRKFQEILDFMRKNSEIFAHIPPEATAVMSSPTDVIGLRVNNGGKGLYFPLSHELIPEKFAGLAQMIKTEISKGTITIRDLGVIEKNSNDLSIKLSTFLGVDRANFPVTAHLVAGTDYLEVTMHDPSHDKLEFCVIDVGEPLRTYAQQNDPEGMSVMRQAYKGPGDTTQIDIEVERAVTRFLERNTATLTPQLRKIESDFRSPHHEFPKDFLAQLEKDIHAEIASGPLGLFFGAENITILCNSISANGVGVHVYICRADTVIFTNIHIGSLGASRHAVEPVLMKQVGKKLEEYFMSHPHNHAPDIRINSENGETSILPGSLMVTPTLATSSGATFGAILKYTTRIHGQSGAQVIGYQYMADFGKNISSALLLPRGLEQKTTFHPLETSSVQEAVGKIPGFSGRKIEIHHILHDGKKRAVATVTFMGRETIDVLLPEAEETAILTNMNPENQKAVQKCIAQSSENFSKHGAILTLGNDLVNAISEAFRAKLADLTVKPECNNGSYRIGIKIKLIDETYYETSISAAELAKMIESYLTGIIEEQKVLSQVDYLVKLNGASSFQERVQNIGHLSLLQSKIPEPTYHIDHLRSGITVNASGEPILRVVFMIEGHGTVFSFELPAKGRYKN